MSSMHYLIVFSGVSLFELSVVFFLSQKIRDEAMTFLREEYKIIALVAIIAGLIGYFMSPLAVLLFIYGVVLSMRTGFIGMHAATDANVRTTMSARDKGALVVIGHLGGGIMGLAVHSFGLPGLSIILFIIITPLITTIKRFYFAT